MFTSCFLPFFIHAFFLLLYIQLIQINKHFERNIVNIFLPTSLNIFLSAQKNRINETILLSTHNKCVGYYMLIR